MESLAGIRNLQGLAEAVAAERLKTDGFNELPSTKQRSIFAIAGEVVREPMFLLLVACGVIYLVLGDKEEALGAVSVRTRGKGDQGSVPLKEFIEKAKGLVAGQSTEL